MRKKLISMSIISTSLTVPTQPLPRFHLKSVVTFQELCNGLLFIIDSSLVSDRWI